MPLSIWTLKTVGKQNEYVNGRCMSETVKWIFIWFQSSVGET